MAITDLHAAALAAKPHAARRAQFALSLNAYCSTVLAEDALKDDCIGWSKKRQSFLFFAADTDGALYNAYLYANEEKLSKAAPALRLADDMWWGLHNYDPAKKQTYLLHDLARAVFASASPLTRMHNWLWTPKGDYPRLPGSVREVTLLLETPAELQLRHQMQSSATLFSAPERSAYRYALLADVFPAHLATTAETLDFGELPTDYAAIHRRKR